jgi:IS5 family transposase
MRFDFGQTNLVEAFVRQRKSKNGWLDDVDQFMDWSRLEALFDGVYTSREGGASYPILTYIKMLFIQQWHGLSDEKLEAAVDDRLSFRRFCGIPLDRPVPDHSSIWRFRQHLSRQGPDDVTLGERLFGEIHSQLDARGLILRRGTLIDATIVEAAVNPPRNRDKKADGESVGEVSELDPDAGFTKKNGKTFFGYKAHAAVDEGSGLFRRLLTTSAQIHDSQACDALIMGDEAAVYADKAYDDTARRKRLVGQGIAARILYKARRNKPLVAWQESFNKVMSRIRAPVEHPFAAMKGVFGFARCRYRGLARNDVHVQLFGCAYNIKRAWGLVA